jgi:NADH-quinone oxidoreductase subunit M
MNVIGVQGAVYQMLAHGISTGGLFYLVGMLSDRRHTRAISEYGGLKGVVPRLTAAFLIITLASIGMPGLNGFIGEFLIMLGAFRWDPRYVVAAGLGVILSAVYMLWMVQRVYYGKVTNPENAHMQDVTVREWAGLAPLCAMALLMGIVPTLFTKPMEPAVRRMVERVQSAEPVRVNNDIQHLPFDAPQGARGDSRTANFKVRAADASKPRGDISLASSPSPR